MNDCVNEQKRVHSLYYFCYLFRVTIFFSLSATLLHLVSFPLIVIVVVICCMERTCHHRHYHHHHHQQHNINNTTELSQLLQCYTQRGVYKNNRGTHTAYTALSAARARVYAFFGCSCELCMCVCFVSLFFLFAHFPHFHIAH